MTANGRGGFAFCPHIRQIKFKATGFSLAAIVFDNESFLSVIVILVFDLNSDGIGSSFSATVDIRVGRSGEALR